MQLHDGAWQAIATLLDIGSSLGVAGDNTVYVFVTIPVGSRVARVDR
jgi:hypothetical protein